MNTLTGSWILVTILIVMVVPIWVALKAKPLAAFPYRWATYWAAESIVIAVVIPWLTVPVMINRGFDAGGVPILLASVLCLSAAVGLFNRMKVGAICLIASEIWIVFLPGLVGALYNSPVSPTEQSSGVLFLVLVIVNLFYFRKRWRSMASGLWSKV